MREGLVQSQLLMGVRREASALFCCRPDRTRGTRNGSALRPRSELTWGRGNSRSRLTAVIHLRAADRQLSPNSELRRRLASSRSSRRTRAEPRGFNHRAPVWHPTVGKPAKPRLGRRCLHLKACAGIVQPSDRTTQTHTTRTYDIKFTRPTRTQARTHAYDTKHSSKRHAHIHAIHAHNSSSQQTHGSKETLGPTTDDRPPARPLRLAVRSPVEWKTQPWHCLYAA